MKIKRTNFDLIRNGRLWQGGEVLDVRTGGKILERGLCFGYLRKEFGFSDLKKGEYRTCQLVEYVEEL